MQQPRHAIGVRVARGRRLLRSVLVGLIALPSVLGVASVVGLTLTAFVPHAAAARNAVRLGRPIRVPGTGTSGAAPSAASVAERNVIGLGDSVPAGASCGCTDYVSLLAQYLGGTQGSTVRSANLATPGQTSAGLLTQLGSPDVQAAVGGADVVVLTIGANDLEATDPTSCPARNSGNSDSVVAACFRDRLDTLTGNLDRALDQLDALSTRPGARVLVTGYWNVYLDGAVARARGDAYVQLADAATRAVNARIAQAARAHGATFVDLFTPFRGSDGSRDCTGLLAPDGDHPDAEGHGLIARTLAAAL